MALLDYYPFGMTMPGRSYSSTAYRFGFNGQEKDDEVSGSGNTMTAEFWEYDSRLGRRWNIDPLWYDWQSPYACFNNNPVYYNDPYGLEGQDNNLGAPTKNNADLPSDKNKVMRVPESEVEKVKDQCFERTEASGHYTVNYFHVPDAPVTDGPRYKGSYDAKGNWTMEKDADGNPIPATEGAYYAVWTWNSKGNAAPNPNPVAGNPNNPPVPVLNNNPPANNPPANNPVVPNRPVAALNIGARNPFVGGMANFVNPVQGNNALRNFANQFIAGGGTRVNITVSTSNAGPATPVNPIGGFANTNALLWGRGLAIQRQLIGMGIPRNAFPRNWLQFQFGVPPGVQITGR